MHCLIPASLRLVLFYSIIISFFSFRRKIYFFIIYEHLRQLFFTEPSSISSHWCSTHQERFDAALSLSPSLPQSLKSDALVFGPWQSSTIPQNCKAHYHQQELAAVVSFWLWYEVLQYLPINIRRSFLGNPIIVHCKIYLITKTWNLVLNSI